MLKLVRLLIKDKKHFALDLKAGLVKEVKPLEKDGAVVDTLKNNIMKSKGLGDSVEKFTKATGIKKLVDSVTNDCGCNKRKNALNKAFPYKK